MQYHLLGAGSSIAKLLAKKLESNNSVNLYSTSGFGQGLNKFFENSIEGSVVIYFCNIQDDLNGNLTLLAEVIEYCKQFKCQFFYISSINAETPDASLYSKIKFECERIVNANGYIWIRLAVVVAEPPFSSYKSLKVLREMPIKLAFPKTQYLHFTDINNFLNIDFSNLHANKRLYSSSMRLNDFIEGGPKKLFKINIGWLIGVLRKLNHFYLMKSIFGRLLTLTAFNRDLLK